MSDVPIVEAWTDASVSPTACGIGVVLRHECGRYTTHHERIPISRDTISCEIFAIGRALEMVRRERCTLIVRSDSFVGIRWLLVGDRDRDKPVVRWCRRMLDEKHPARLEWVQGHSSHYENALANYLANCARTGKAPISECEYRAGWRPSVAA